MQVGNVFQMRCGSECWPFGTIGGGRQASTALERSLTYGSRKAACGIASAAKAGRQAGRTDAAGYRVLQALRMAIAEIRLNSGSPGLTVEICTKRRLCAARIRKPVIGKDGRPRNGRCPHMAVSVLSLLGQSRRLGSPQSKQHKRVGGRVIEQINLRAGHCHA